MGSHESVPGEVYPGHAPFSKTFGIRGNCTASGERMLASVPLSSDGEVLEDRLSYFLTEKICIQNGSDCEVVPLPTAAKEIVVQPFRYK